MKPHKISSHSAHSDIFFSIGCLIKLKFSRNSFSNRCWKFPLSILEKRQSFIPKKLWFKSRVSWLHYQNKPILYTDPIFINGFAINYELSNVTTRLIESWKQSILLFWFHFSYVKFIYSEKATKFCEILLLSYVVPVKNKVKISQNFVAFSEYMNFT